MNLYTPGTPVVIDQGEEGSAFGVIVSAHQFTAQVRTATGIETFYWCALTVLDPNEWMHKLVKVVGGEPMILGISCEVVNVFKSHAYVLVSDRGSAKPIRWEHLAPSDLAAWTGRDYEFAAKYGIDLGEGAVA